MADRAGKPAKKAAAKPAKKTAPRTKGTPAKPPAPRKVAGASKSRAPAAKPKPAAPARAPRTGAPAKPGPRAPVPAVEPQWVPAQLGWTQVERTEPEWIPVPAPPATPVVAAPPQFDPVTGAWLPAGEVAAAPDPAAYARGATRSIVMHIILGITFALFAFSILYGIAVGVALLAAPDSEFAQDAKKAAEEGSSPGFIILNQLVTFLMVGVVPFFWVVGTRVVPWRGAVQYLRLRVKVKDVLLGVALVPLMIGAVMVLLVSYVCAVDGCDALDDEAEEGALSDDNLTWPVVIIVALCAGIGEELLFRGILQRYIGIWGQAAIFGLAHAVNAFPPQVIFAFGLGAAFGYLYRRGWSLVSLMVAHTLYDFTLLSLAKMGLG